MAAGAYGAWHESRLRRLLDRLVRLRPGSGEADQARWAAEHLLMKALAAGGVRAVDRTIAALNAEGHRFERASHGPTRRYWTEPIGDEGHELGILVSTDRVGRMASVSFTPARPVLALTPAQQRRHRIQEAFYARYMEAGRRAYARPPRRLGAADRLLLLVGELEADIYNGGFDQYLFNKGRRRAHAALEALKAIRARRTARLLQAALRPSTTREDLLRLDDRFYGRPEDLAWLAMRHVETRAKRPSGGA